MQKLKVLQCLQTVFPKLSWKPEELGLFLKTIGLMNPSGNLYIEREKKMYEIIYFSGFVVKCIGNISRKREVALLDCGCGRSYLPFFLNNVLKKLRRNIKYVGIDSNPVLIRRIKEISDKLGYTNMEFQIGKIIDFETDQKINILSALHACDTATDEAIARGIQLSARFIIVAPCCQRQIIKQVGHVVRRIPSLKPLIETKVSKEYIGVALTEILRKTALETFGYKVDIFKFISSRYTPKNIMIRAEKMQEMNLKSLQAFRNLKNYFNVKPKIQEFLCELQ